MYCEIVYWSRVAITYGIKCGVEKLKTQSQQIQTDSRIEESAQFVIKSHYHEGHLLQDVGVISVAGMTSVSSQSRNTHWPDLGQTRGQGIASLWSLRRA